MRKSPKKRHSIIPGFGLSMGYTITYLSLIVLIPLSSVIIKT
ncbi:MAG: sulfate ABC transporter permease subunit CysT, partial [bacterium]